MVEHRVGHVILERQSGHLDIEPIGEEDVNDADGECGQEESFGKDLIAHMLDRPFFGEIVGVIEKAANFDESEEDKIPRHHVVTEEHSDREKQSEIDSDGPFGEPSWNECVSKRFEHIVTFWAAKILLFLKICKKKGKINAIFVILFANMEKK